jgi:hypothetical protein
VKCWSHYNVGEANPRSSYQITVALMPNNLIEFARGACPTRNGEAPLLAAHSRRYA